jgi:hypothetical protein
MHGTLEELRDHYPGKWLLIELDDSEAEEGTVLAAHEDPEAVDKELERRFRPKTSRSRPLYVAADFSRYIFYRPQRRRSYSLTLTS